MSQKTILLPSNCLGCAIRLVAFRDIREKDWSSLYIETLSDHVYQWIGSWRGRLYLAKRALQGKINDDIACETIDEMKALHKAIGEMIEFVEADRPNVLLITKQRLEQLRKEYPELENVGYLVCPSPGETIGSRAHRQAKTKTHTKRKRLIRGTGPSGRS